MDVWMRWVVALSALVVAIVLAVRWEGRIRRTAIRASRRSWRRALLLLVGYHAALVLVGLAATVVVVAVRDAGAEALAVVLVGLLFASIAPFTVPFMPSQVVSSAQDATSRRDLRRAGATTGVSRVWGWGGALLWFVTATPLGVLAVVGIFVDPSAG